MSYPHDLPHDLSPGEEAGLRGVGGGGLEGLGGRRGREPSDITEGEGEEPVPLTVCRAFGDERYSSSSSAGEPSLLRLNRNSFSSLACFRLSTYFSSEICFTVGKTKLR